MSTSDPTLLGTAQRNAADVLQDHLQQREAGELEADLRHDRMAMLEWSATGPNPRIVDGVDSYLIEDGLIKAQTIHYRVRSRQLSVSWDAATPSS